jgi:hypothetical protein
MEILNEALETECTCKTHGEWETFALGTLHNNDVPPLQFSSYVKELLLKGQGKYRNLMLTGPANCGKTFLLNPLNKIYQPCIQQFRVGWGRKCRSSLFERLSLVSSNHCLARFTAPARSSKSQPTCSQVAFR